MEGFSQIKGLWDALNTHDFNNVLGFENVLKDSERFMKLVQAIKANKAKKFTTNYNTNQNDFDITIEKVKDQKVELKIKGISKLCMMLEVLKEQVTMLLPRAQKVIIANKIIGNYEKYRF